MLWPDHERAEIQGSFNVCSTASQYKNIYQYFFSDVFALPVTSSLKKPTRKHSKTEMTEN